MTYNYIATLESTAKYETQNNYTCKNTLATQAMWCICFKSSAVLGPGTTCEQSGNTRKTRLESTMGFSNKVTSTGRHQALRYDSYESNSGTEKPAFIRDDTGKLFFGKLEIQKTLGVGAQAKVLLAQNTTTYEYYALKVIDKSNLSKHDRQHVDNEIVALRTIKHPNVLTLRDVYAEVAIPSSRSTQMKTAIVLVLDLCSGGELFDLMLCIGGFPESVAITYFAQILGAISTCHAAGIYHRDIKPQNILLDSNYQVKVADFGLSALHAVGYDICNTYCGTMSYMAPEILAEMPYSGAKADSWSLGILLFFMLAGNPPLKSATLDDWWYKAILTRRMDLFWHAHERLSPSFSKPAQAILSRMLVANPAYRCHVEDLLDDAWLDGPMLSPCQLRDMMISQKKKAMATETGKNLQKLRDRQAEIANKGMDEVLDTFSIGTKQSTAPPPDLSTWKIPEEVACAYENVFHDDPDGFFVKSKAAYSVLDSLRLACTESGANKLETIDSWTLRVSFDDEGAKNNVKGKNENVHNQIVFEIFLYNATKVDEDMIFVRLNQICGDRLVGELLMKLICRGALRRSKMVQ